MDKGHEKLIEDISNLLEQVKVFAFHDFKSQAYATPKMELVHYLDHLRDNVIKGNYDN